MGDKEGLFHQMSLSKHPIPPSYAWLTIFIPALAYFLGSRLQHTRLSGGSLGILVQDKLLRIDLPDHAQQVFFLDSKSPKTLLRGLHLVHSNGLEDIVDTLWKHDDELGRGFLLISQSAKTGRIWRWEVGGGPFAIGKTLHMEHSGCRYKHSNCSSVSQGRGSGGLAIDFGSEKTSAEGRLLVAEWGEQRVVRMEPSGARTPLVLQVPRLCSVSDQSEQVSLRRIYQPSSLLYTTYGDLIVADYDAQCQQAALYYLDNAMAIPPLSSMLESRKAHEWTTTRNHDVAVKIFYTVPGLTAIGGLALDLTWKGLYAAVRIGDMVQILHLFLNDDDDEPLWDGQAEVLYQWQTGSNGDNPGPLVVDQKGYIYAGLEQQLIILSKEGTLVASIELPEQIVSLTLGQDSFLYLSSATNLYRMKVRNLALKVPTNLVVLKKQ